MQVMKRAADIQRELRGGCVVVVLLGFFPVVWYFLTASPPPSLSNRYISFFPRLLSSPGPG